MTQSPFLTLGTRGSPLAMAQAYETQARLAAAHGIAPGEVAIEVIKTTGDQIRDRALSEAGGKGLFTKELDVALLEGRIDIAVHSGKDVPTFLDPGQYIAGFLPREDVRDALISRHDGGLASLPQGARVGSASIRRQAQLLRARPDLSITLLRGNVETRLARVAAGDFDATLLALAGLRRLGLAEKVTAILPVDQFLPAVGQGAIAIAARTGDSRIAAALAPILDRDTVIALTCERAFLARLDGSCRTPIAGLAEHRDGRVTFRGEVLSPDGRTAGTISREGPADQAAALGDEAGRALLAARGETSA